MSDLTIVNALPANLVVLSEAVINRIDIISHKAYAVTISDVDSLRVADALHKEMRGLQREIETGRKALTAPLDSIKAQAIEAERMGTEPLKLAVEALGARIQDFLREQEKQRQAALRAAEEERQRRQAEEDARAEEARRQAIQQAEIDAPPGEEPAPVSAFVATPKAVSAPYVPPALKSSAVRKQTDYTLVIEDASLVPVEIAGAVIRPIDESLCKRLLKAGTKIPGLRLDASVGVAAKGG